MSVKRLMLAAAVAIFGFSLAGCVDGGPYYGDYSYSGYYSPGYYGGPGYYGNTIYGGYYTTYERPGYRRYHHRYRDSGHYRQSGNRGGPAYQDRNRNWRGQNHGANRGAVRSSYSGSNGQASVRNGHPSYRGGNQGGSSQNRHRKNNEQQ